MATQASNDHESVALALFSAQEVERYTQVIADVDTIKRGLDRIVIRTQEDAAAAHNLLTDVKRTQLRIEETRKTQVNPLNDQVRAINALWKPKTDRLGLIETSLKNKILAFNQAERERVAREQAIARKRQEEADARVAAAAKKAEEAKTDKARGKALDQVQAATQDLLEARLAEPMDAPTGIRTELGTSSSRMQWTFEVMDPAQVPRQFLIVDDKAIRRAVAEGVRSIAGVSIFEKEVLATRV